MIWTIGAWLLMAGTLCLYLVGTLSGFTSLTVLLIFGILALAQIALGIWKRAWKLVGWALLSLGLLGMWELSGWIHRGILSFAKKDAVLSHMMLVPHMAAFMFSLFPFLLLCLALVLAVKASKVSFKSLFFDWSFSPSSKENPMYPSIRICKDAETGQDIYLNGEDRFLHLLVAGPTGSGKTALTLGPFVYQDIEYVAKGGHARVIVVEPDGEFTEDLAEYCEELGVPYLRIDATNPGDFHWNPFEGKPADVAESITSILKSSGSKQEFFDNVNEATSRNVALLLKLIHGDNLTVLDYSNALRSVDKLKALMKELRKKKSKLSKDDRYMAENVLASLENEIANEMQAEHFQKVCMGLRQKLENLIGNPNVRRILDGPSSFRFSDLYETPGVLLINTGNTPAGDMFGKFLLMAMQFAALDRPGKAKTRTPVFLYVDEFSRYVSERFDEILKQGRKYRVALSFAFQSFGDLELSSYPQYKRRVKTNARNKIILSGLEYDDALEAERMMGTKEETMTTTSYSEGLFSRDGERISETTREKARFSANYLMFMPWNQIVYKIISNKQTLEPKVGIVDYPKRKRIEQIQRSFKGKKIRDAQHLIPDSKENLSTYQNEVPLRQTETAIRASEIASGTHTITQRKIPLRRKITSSERVIQIDSSSSNQKTNQSSQNSASQQAQMTMDELW
ncbi:hypothetical protein DNHGIG_40710 [Collibacillus ludicampi]|uniref:TraD/TraG TraM recognition site domain-containing protein n=1 Tax=Collibacillus ludicampi TaxID=2771369 RepID=A0AAV4LNM5_9BACL|nr:hypothetical protein DNHGIG_40710 [Collibacillus ludicampi]